jgi:hypothetical protein
MSTSKTSPVGAYVHERGGLTNNADDGAEAVDHFDFCPNCEREVPIDSEGGCMHCFKLVSKQNLQPES